MVTDEKVKERDHVATAAEREHWSTERTFSKQMTAVGADTIATTKHPDLQKAKEWYREHVRRQSDNSLTPPQSSNWQWQDWNDWQSGSPQDGESVCVQSSERKTRPLTLKNLKRTRCGSGDR